jgi:hypothetical protein
MIIMLRRTMTVKRVVELEQATNLTTRRAWCDAQPVVEGQVSGSSGRAPKKCEPQQRPAAHLSSEVGVESQGAIATFSKGAPCNYLQ